ncbi:HAD family hydrolase [Vibrio splendidus]
MTKDIISVVAPHLSGENLPKYLLSETLYHEANHGAKNWQALYVDYYGLSHDEMLIAGGMWAEYQEKNQTAVALFDGMNTVVSQFAHLPHGICSQNSQLNIRGVLDSYGIGDLFKSVVGYDDVSNGHQKPHPFGGVKCVENIFGADQSNELCLMYIGDHEADTQFARNIEAALGKNAKVIAVAAGYSRSEPENWQTKPDYIANHVDDLLTIVGKYT